MAEYIERDKAIDELRQYIVDPEKAISDNPDDIEKFNDGIDTAISVLSTLPTADVSLVKWTPVDEGLPKSPYGCLLIVWDTEPMTGGDFLNYLPYFAGWDGEQWNDADGDQVPFEVAYWMPLPTLPKEE